MVIAPLLSSITTLCLYRKNGQEITFKIHDNIVVKPSLPLHPEERYYIENTYLKNL